MVDRTLLAAALGVGLGFFFLAAPAAVVRVHLVGRRPHGGNSEYGQAHQPPATWLWVVRAVGVALIGAGLFFGWRALG